jgi:mannose-6-phosphate isomerase-like protein (cupin superfamily)
METRMMKRHLYLILCMAVVALFAVYGIDRSKPPGGVAGAAKARDADSASGGVTIQEPAPKPIFLPPGGGRIIEEVKDGGPKGHLIFKLGGGESGSTFEFAEARTPPNGGPPVHIHFETDEAFYVVSGTFRVKVGDQVRDVGPGSFVFAPC